MFFRNTDIWTMGDVCPAPKIWVPYTPPDYSTYKQQSLPSYVRGKRASNGKECLRETDQKPGCATDRSYISIDATSCKDGNLYTPEKLVLGMNSNCCLQPNFRINARAVGTRLGRKKLFKSAKDTCCTLFSDRTGGVDALTQFDCAKSK